MIPSQQQDIIYNAFMQPEKVTEGQYELSYTYGADYNRIKSVTKQNGSVTNTRYYFSNFEKDITGGTTRYIQYISSPVGLVAIVETINGNHTAHYTYTDHLGSILAVTNSSGSIEAEQNFDAWGRRRDKDSWVLIAPTAVTGLPVWLYRGYTGHEMLDNFGIINMNGRLYDPILGRMLSPDNYVADGGYSQDYNRYTYARNNPLKYTDPSGEFLLSGIFGFIDGFFSTSGNRFKAGWNEASHRVNMEDKIWTGIFKTDPNKKFGQRTWEIFSRATWQLPQVLVGQSSAHVVNTIFGNVNSVNYAYGATVVQTGGEEWGGITMGNYILGDNTIEANANNPLFQHEYGHYIQSQKMGPAFFVRVGIPSVLSKGEHHFHPVEQDANRRAFLYFNRNVAGFQNDIRIDANGNLTEDRGNRFGNPRTNLGWDFDSNPLNIDGSNTRNQYVNFATGLNLDRLNVLKVRATFWDYAHFDPVLVALNNAFRYNR